MNGEEKLILWSILEKAKLNLDLKPSEKALIEKYLNKFSAWADNELTKLDKQKRI